MTRETLPGGLLFCRRVTTTPLHSVVEALQRQDDGQRSSVFVKRLSALGQSSEQAWDAFRREAILGEALFAAGARVPRIVTAAEDELGPYVVTAAVPGKVLPHVGPAFASWPSIARAAFAALASVHAAVDARGSLDVVHNDVHLDNLLFALDADVGPEPTVQAWLLDFGLATARARPDLAGHEPPLDGVFRGTLRYAAPEAARGEVTTASSDRFSLAAALLHRASGIGPRGAVNASPELLVRAGSDPLDEWVATVARVSAEPVAELSRALAPLLCFDAGDRRAGPAW